MVLLIILLLQWCGVYMLLLMTLIDFRLNIIMDIWPFGMLALWLNVTSTVTVTSTSTSDFDFGKTGGSTARPYGWPAFISTLFYRRDFPAESVWI